MGTVAAALAATPCGGLARKTVATAARAENPQHPIGVENISFTRILECDVVKSTTTASIK